MSAKHVIGSLLLLAPMVASAQDAKPSETKGEFTVEGRKVDIDPASAKYNEYSDIRNGFPHYTLGLGWVNAKTGAFLDVKGTNLLRDDQSIRVGFGKFGLWSLVLDRDETPHNLSFRAMTPLRNQGNGLFTADSTVGTPNQNLAGTAPQQLANDAATAAWLPGQLRATSLGTQRDRMGATFTLTPTDHLKLRLLFSDEQREGSKIGYGPIGDRPPRTLNIQLAQPVDYSTREMRLEAEYNRSRVQAQFTYTVSKFENNIDTLRWQNIYTDNVVGTTFDQWTGHRVATFGQRALDPDNQYQNATLAVGVNLPWSSRLAVTVAYGHMEQDKALLPYATSDFGNTGGEDFSSPEALARHSAEAEITTKRINVDYSLNPLAGLNLRAYLHYYDLDNKTPVSDWWYITSDTIPGSAAATLPLEPTEFNKRRNLAYSFTQNTKGLEASTYLPFWRTSLGLSLEREDMDRTHREADTAETTVKATFRTRPAQWLSLRGKILMGNRDGGTYAYNAPVDAYWYEQAELPTAESMASPRFSFINHPDMRKFDVSDRKRKEWDLTALLKFTEALDISVSHRDRRDDFDSDVKAIQPLLGNAFAATNADRDAYTPGNQLGLLKNDLQRTAVDITYAASERLVFNAFATRERIKARQRGIEFNENNKLNPVSVVPSLATNELGNWTRATSQWMAASEDRTNTYGAGLNYQFIPEKLDFSLEYVQAHGTVDIFYSGFGALSAVNPANVLADNYQFAFRTPPTVRTKQTTLNAKLGYQLNKSLRATLQYAFDRYDLSDWMQEADTPWTESVGSPYLLRDTSRSNQWGNRLVSLGSYLAPTYDAHYLGVSLSYKF